ncbi:PREDICTED: pentatricopeptide repeat-containing protein At1g77170 [Tarenaya hassleriana]|uniref:pentatricopeptide repeat-containing protein At1g77170 n=1 Tax=Tarenaya hassleriana TaxID=28532 RepID=UPI00053CA200|nr:PREDICTED: pentatricopeptide repeat-containing protein At1g77170 [Tarenaya hassleriana]
MVPIRQIPSPSSFHRLCHFFSVTAYDVSLVSYPPSSTTSQSPPERTKAIATLLSNCTTLSHVRQVHAHLLCSRILELCSLPFHWNNIIRAYTRQVSPLDALSVYFDMARSGILPDRFTLPIVLKAAVQFYDTQMGKQLHCVATRLGLVRNEFCESGFITLYCRAGEFENARKLFDENPQRKLGSWNAIIAGFSQAGRAGEAMDMFMEMRREGFEPDDFTMVCVTSACGALGNFNLAFQLHKYVLQARTQDKSDIMMMNSLVDMYGKCGRMDLAEKVFAKMPVRNVRTWTSMIMGYATHGRTEEAFERFNQMRESGIRPNHVTFIAILTACVHGGLVEEGKTYFRMMKEEFGREPGLPHYGCMVDLLGRAGRLKEAREMVEGMPMDPNVVVWGCLMGACEKFGDIETGEWVAQHLVELEPWNDGVYVVLANVYAKRGMWDEVERVRNAMKEKKLSKLPGFSYASSSSSS